MRIAAKAAIILLLLTAYAGAWGTKEHIQMTRLAAERLIADPATPPDMVQWLQRVTPGLLDINGERDYFLQERIGIAPRAADGLPYWSTMPDILAMAARDKPVRPFGLPERSLHFIDLELFMPDEADRVYADDLSHKPKLDRFPRDMSDPRYQKAGMLPFRVEQCYREMVDALRIGRLHDKPGQYPRDEHAARWAGFLAHYAADNTQPHHATIDYRSAAYFRDPNQVPNVHADFEHRLGDDDYEEYPELRRQFWAEFTKALDHVNGPAVSDDPWQATLEVALISYDGLPLVGRAGAAAYAGAPDASPRWFKADVFFHYRGTFRGQEMTLMQFKARQMAWAVRRIEHLWLAAWKEAREPRMQMEQHR